MEPYASPARQAQTGKRLKAKFFKAIPAIKCLIDDVQAAVSARPWLYGIDKRRLHVRSKHAALNHKAAQMAIGGQRKAAVAAAQTVEDVEAI